MKKYDIELDNGLEKEVNIELSKGFEELKKLKNQLKQIDKLELFRFKECCEIKTYYNGEQCPDYYYEVHYPLENFNIKIPYTFKLTWESTGCNDYESYTIIKDIILNFYEDLNLTKILFIKNPAIYNKINKYLKGEIKWNL